MSIAVAESIQPAQQNPQPQVEKAEPKLILHGLDTYRFARAELRNKLEELIRHGDMTEATANRILTETEYNFFVQLVKYELA